MSYIVYSGLCVQNTMKVTGESTLWFNCMVLLRAYGVPTLGGNIVTTDVGTACGKEGVVGCDGYRSV